LEPILDTSSFSLLALICVIVTAAGYIINDIYDYEIDVINKPSQVIINRRLSANHAWIIYITFNLAAILLSIYLSSQLNQFGFLAIIIFSILSLWLYSKSLKKVALIGNLTVAFFCALVPGILAFAERQNYISLEQKDPMVFQQLLLMIGGYIVFAFCSTMIREIIKDLEDMEGDFKAGAKTIPIAWSVNIAKIVAYFFASVLLGVFGLWAFNESINIMAWDKLYLMIGVALPIFYLNFKLAFAKSKPHFHHLSQVTKGIMIMGLLYIVIWYF